MSVNYRIYPDVFGEQIAKIRGTGLLEDVNAPYYEYGTYLELTKELVEKDRIRALKFPLIWLVWGNGDNKESHNNGGNYNVSPQFFIIDLTKFDYKSEEREINVFTPVLYPILNALLLNMSNSQYYTSSQVSEYDKINHYKFGKNGSKWMLGSPTDAIEINHSNSLEIQKYC